MSQWTAERRRRNLALFVRFGLVGASGVLVNLVVVVLFNRSGPSADQSLLPIPLTDFNVRWYHAYSTVAFLVANLWNFQLNRSWTFRSAGRATWLREFRPFLVVGVLAQLIGLGLLTALMHPGSWIALPVDLLDDSTGLRTRLYWGQLIVIAAVTPLSFVLHKLWTFSSVRTFRLDDGATEADGPVVEGTPDGRRAGPATSRASRP